MAISYEDYKKKIQEKYKYTTERNPRKPLNQRYNAIARGSYYDIDDNAMSSALNKYNTYYDAIGTMSNFSDKAVNSALEQATNNMNTYKSNIIDAAKKNNIETSNNKNIVKSQSEYGKEELDYLRNNKYEALKNVKEPLKLTDVASFAQKKYKENKEKFDELVKENKDYKEYDEYLYNAVPLLQNMKNINEVNKEGVSTTDKIFTPLISNAKSSLKNIFMPSSGNYRLANGNLVNLPSQSELESEKVLNSYETGLGKLYGNVTAAIGQQLPSMAIGLATGGLGTAAGASASAINAARTVGSLSSMFANVSRNTTNQKLMEGYTKEQANQYGLMSGVVETATELMFGGLGKLMGTGALDRVVTDRLTRNIRNRVFRTLADAGISSVGEGVEEVVSDLLQPVVQQIALDDPRKYSEIMKDQNVLEDFLVGTISSLIMSAPSTVVSFANNNQTNSQVNNNNQVNLPPATNLQDSIVNDAVNSRIDQNSINVPIISRNQLNSRNETLSTDIIPYTQHEIENFQNGKVKVAQSESDISSFVEAARKVPSNAKLYFGKLGTKIANKINQALGINLENYNLSLKTDSIRHILNHHSSRTEELRGQVPVTAEDFKLLPEIVTNYDNIQESGTSKQGKPSITFEKQIGDNYYVVTYVSDKSNSLEVQTMYKIKAQKKNSASVSDANIPRLTSETNSGTSSLYNNNSTNPTQSQIAPLPLNNMQNDSNNMQNVNLLNSNRVMNPVEISQLTQEDANTTPILPNVQRNQVNGEKTNLPKNKQEYKVIADRLNETIQNDKITIKENEVKQRKWVDTSLESEAVKDKVLIDDLDSSKINYVVQSNKKTLEKANNKLSVMGYDTSVEYIKSKIHDSSVSLEDVALAQRLIQEAIKSGDNTLASELIMDTAILGTELGQKVQALSLIQKLTPEGQLQMFQKIVQRSKAKGDKSFQGVEITPEMVEMILGAYKSDGTFDQNDLNNRVEQFKKKVAEQLTTTTGEKVVAWRYLSMLGNPKTHLRNIISNVAMWGTMKYKNAIARTAEGIFKIDNRTKTWKKASKTVSEYAKEVTTEMKDVITGESKYNEKTSLESEKSVFNNKLLEKARDFNSNMLSTEDWLFSRNAFENTFKEYLTAQGISTKADIENNSEVIEKGKLYALEQAEIATFRQYSWLANKISQIERKNTLSKLAVGSMLPFKKTPINIAKTGVKYSPIGLAKALTVDLMQVRKGNMEASQMIDNFAQGFAGTSLTLIGYALAKAGILNGAGSDDKEGKYDYNLGKQSYSIKIGDGTFSISWLSPVAMPLLVGANAYEKLEEKEDWDMNIVMETLAETLDPLSEMSFVSSLTDTMQSYSQGSMQMISSIGENIVQNYMTQFIPTILSQFAATTDDTKRTTRAANNSKWKFGEETLNKIKYKIPGLRNTLEPSTDIWGNEIKQSENVLVRALENFITPYSKKNDISTDLDKEIKRIYNATGETSVIPNIPYGYVKYKDETYQMSAKEYTSLKKIYGTTSNNLLNELIQNDFYKNANDNEKASMIEYVYDLAYAQAKEDYFKGKDIEFDSNELKTLNKLNELEFNNSQIAEYAALDKLTSSIKNNESMESEEKKRQIVDNILKSSFNDRQLSYVYSKYYSSEEVLNNLIEMRIPIKEFIKFDTQEFEGDYNTRTGKTVSGSRKNKVIQYVNSLNLSIPQKAILIKMEYNSYDNYNNQIVNYINGLNKTVNDKKVLLKSIGFDNFNKDVVEYINSQNISIAEKEEKLKDLGFTIRNGRVYW